MSQLYVCHLQHTRIKCRSIGWSKMVSFYSVDINKSLTVLLIDETRHQESLFLSLKFKFIISVGYQGKISFYALPKKIFLITIV